LTPETVAELPALLGTLTANVDTRRPRPTRGNSGGTLTGGYEPSGLGWVRDHVEQIMHTGTTTSVTMKGRPTVLITYRGARTGKVRKTPVMRIEHEGHYAAVASKGGEPTHPQWYASLVAEPVVDLQDGTETRTYRAREVFGDDKSRWWRRAVEVFPDFADYQARTDRPIPVFVLEPISENEGQRYRDRR
jgi:deazaflavin-dependent oxidoreductase (nitroreductase family)